VRNNLFDLRRVVGVDDPWDAYARWVSDALALRG
jgi:hypothetical protein